ncbi:MAG: hypothetical protein Q7R81_01300 [Candidatus Peregrinibacteria bacterium]|nr:hypothetical protein [Candidatus Peregrinibacteria bacterium]
MPEAAEKTISTIAAAMKWFDRNIGEYQAAERRFLQAILDGKIQEIIATAVDIPENEMVTFDIEALQGEIRKHGLLGSLSPSPPTPRS